MPLTVPHANLKAQHHKKKHGGKGTWKDNFQHNSLSAIVLCRSDCVVPCCCCCCQAVSTMGPPGLEGVAGHPASLHGASVTLPHHGATGGVATAASQSLSADDAFEFVNQGKGWAETRCSAPLTPGTTTTIAGSTPDIADRVTWVVQSTGRATEATASAHASASNSPCQPLFGSQVLAAAAVAAGPRLVKGQVWSPIGQVAQPPVACFAAGGVSVSADGSPTVSGGGGGGSSRASVVLPAATASAADQGHGGHCLSSTLAAGDVVERDRLRAIVYMAVPRPLQVEVFTLAQVRSLRGSQQCSLILA